MLATKVPNGRSLTLGVRVVARAYRVNVPGKLKRRAAVTSCLNLGDALKYAGMVAAYMSTQATLKV